MDEAVQLHVRQRRRVQQQARAEAAGDGQRAVGEQRARAAGAAARGSADAGDSARVRSTRRARLIPARSWRRSAPSAGSSGRRREGPGRSSVEAELRVVRTGRPTASYGRGRGGRARSPPRGRAGRAGRLVSDSGRWEQSGWSCEQVCGPQLRAGLHVEADGGAGRQRVAPAVQRLRRSAAARRRWWTPRRARRRPPSPPRHEQRGHGAAAPAPRLLAPQAGSRPPTASTIDQRPDEGEDLEVEVPAVGRGSASRPRPPRRRRGPRAARRGDGPRAATARTARRRRSRPARPTSPRRWSMAKNCRSGNQLARSPPHSASE